MYLLRPVTLALLVALLAYFAAHARPAQAEDITGFEAARFTGVVPSPREITVDTQTRVDLKHFQIALGSEALLQSSAASEINRKLRLLDAPELVVLSGLPASGDTILIASANDPGVEAVATKLGVTTSKPGTQGYGIEMIELDGRHIIAIIGSDDQGAFYGAMTLWHMLRVENGQTAWQKGCVRDWPAFRRRALGHLGDWGWLGTITDDMTEAQLDAEIASKMSEAEQKARWLALHKINYAYLIGDRLSPGKDKAIHYQDRLMGEISRMALERYNIRTRRTWGTGLNHELGPDEWLDCVMRGQEKHCWTADAAHEEHATNLIKRSQILGLTNFVLHAVDGGRLYDPEWWSRRCERCKAKYGNDHTRAAHEQFNYYYGRLKKEMPGAEYEAVIWPYHFQWAVDGFAENYKDMTKSLPHQGMIKGLENPENAVSVVAELKKYHRTMNDKLPKDTLITFREGGPREFAAATALHKDHPLNIWVYWGRTEGTQPVFFPQVRFTKTWLRPDADDQIHTEKSRRFDWIQPIAANEYAWNPDQPDAEPTFETYKRLYAEEGHNVTDYQKNSLIPRITQSLWGDAGKRYAFFFENTFAPRYFADPEKATNRAFDAEAQDDPYVFMEDQLTALRASLPELDPLIDEVATGNLMALTDGYLHEYGVFPAAYLIAYGNLAWVKGEAEYGLVRAKRLAESGQQEDAAAALAQLEKMWPVLEERQIKVKTVFENMPGWPGWNRGDEALLWDYNLAARRPVLEDMKVLISSNQSAGIPAHIQELIEGREVAVAPQQFKNPFKADAMRGEGRWHRAQPIEFLTLAGTKLAKYPTRVWMLYDATALYVLAEMQDPVKPISEERERDGDVWEDDSFEIFLMTDENQVEPIQIAINSNGDRYDRHPTMQRKKWTPDYDLAVRTPPGMWAVEMRIPFAELAVTPPRPGTTWKINVCRNRLPKDGSPEYEHANIIGDDNNWLMDAYKPLGFTDGPASIIGMPTAQIKDMTRTNKTTEYGYSTILTFVPEVVSYRQAWKATVAVRVVHGGQTLAHQETELDVLQGLWTTPRLIGMDLGQIVEGPLEVVIKATAPDGEIDLEMHWLVAPDGTMTRLRK